MIPVDFKHVNRVFTKPPSMTEEQCASLPTCITNDINGFTNIISCWQLNEDELEIINNSGLVWLRVVGQGMPPVSVEVQNPFTDAKEEDSHIINDRPLTKSAEQISILAEFFMNNLEGEPSKDESVVECAIRLLRDAYVVEDYDNYLN